MLQEKKEGKNSAIALVGFSEEKITTQFTSRTVNVTADVALGMSLKICSSLFLLLPLPHLPLLLLG